MRYVKSTSVAATDWAEAKSSEDDNLRVMEGLMHSPAMLHKNIKSYEAEQARLRAEIARLKGNPKMAGEIESRRSQQRMLQDNIDTLFIELRKLSIAMDRK